jgi:putative DNA primase/helicase
VSAPDFGINLSIGENRAACPRCAEIKKRARDDALAVHVDFDGGGRWICHRCGYAGGWRADRCTTRAATPLSAANPIERRAHTTTLSDYGRQFWERACKPLAGIAINYLERRGCLVPALDADLRWHPRLPHPSGHVGPALVARVTNARSRAPLTLHRTWISEDGTKVNIERRRMLLPGHTKREGVIRLFADEDISQGLAIAEGIETALTGARAFRPVWSVVDAGNLGTFPVLNGIGALTIFADHDERGLAAADACAERWTAAGREVRVVVAPAKRADFNDYAKDGA